MSVLTKEEFLNTVKEIVGDSTEDKDISLIENLTDTYNSLEASSNSNEVDEWKNKYADLQAKYKERFFTHSEPSDEPQFEPEHPVKIKTFEELFKEEK